ncbi:MAG: YbhB/YbcL family Raf kinase inhibitor-like protein [bacterium]|nr:YbhB/YbcL family Raf kinase inhibitor-like protein [bacterium]
MKRAIAAAAALAVACPAAGGRRDPGGGDSIVTIRLVSAAFRDGEAIPRKHTCDGADVSPPLAWENLPAGTKGIALVCDDPDAPAGTWVHWVAWDIPPEAEGLPEGVPPAGALPGGGRQGVNDFGKTGYGGPCPPSGTHRYYFRVYALDAVLGLSGKVTKERLLQAMQGRVLAEGRLMGTYRR